MSELAFVVHERFDVARLVLVPDEEVLFRLSGAVDGSVELLQAVSWPIRACLITFDHLLSFVVLKRYF